MSPKRKKIFKIIFLSIIIVWSLYFVISFRNIPAKINYGVSFNTLYARELGLDWKDVYDNIIDDLGVKKIRLSAHWTLVEPEKDKFSFDELDYQVNKASENNVEIILAVGKRLPRWPECHIPNWAADLNKEETEKEILEYLEKVVTRYKDNKNIKIWQVENEPYLSFFAKEYCNFFDEKFLDKEIELVRKLDSSRKILITDSGELSTWMKAYSKGDIFGTTLYVYAWNKYFGDFRSLVWPGFYSTKRNIWNLVYGEKESIVAELSLEPWLDKSILDEPIQSQTTKMSKENFEDVLKFAKKTGFETQYLWGAEWWYYLKLQNEDWYWNRGKELFKN